VVRTYQVTSVFSFRRSIDLTVSPTADVCEVGQPIRARVIVVARRDVMIRLAVVYMVRRVWYEKKPPMFISGTVIPASATEPARDRTYIGPRTKLDLVGSLAAGERIERTAVVPQVGNIPLSRRQSKWTVRAQRIESAAVMPQLGSIPSGGHAKRRRIEHWVRAEVAGNRGQAQRAAAPVMLVAGRAVHQAVEGFSPSALATAWELELAPRVLHIRPGETLRGTLRVKPSRPVRARRVSIRPVFIEVSRQPMRFPQPSVWLAHEIDLATPREFLFAVRLAGDAAPTLRAPELWFSWQVEGHIDYDSLTKGDTSAYELNVYAGSP